MALGLAVEGGTGAACAAFFLDAGLREGLGPGERVALRGRAGWLCVRVTVGADPHAEVVFAFPDVVLALLVSLACRAGALVAAQRTATRTRLYTIQNLTTLHRHTYTCKFSVRTVLVVQQVCFTMGKQTVVQSTLQDQDISRDLM